MSKSICQPRCAAALVVLWAAWLLAALAQEAVFYSGFDERPLNDTGMVFSGYGSDGLRADCQAGDPPAQDCFFGRDATAAAGTLVKIGARRPSNGVANGFDYTRVCNSARRPAPAAARPTRRLVPAPANGPAPATTPPACCGR